MTAPVSVAGVVYVKGSLPIMRRNYEFDGADNANFADAVDAPDTTCINPSIGLGPFSGVPSGWPSLSDTPAVRP